LLKGKKIVITGGAGFIGSNIARMLCCNNFVTIIDNLSTGKLENLSDVMKEVDFIQGDITEMEALRRAFQGADYVLHLAALPSVQRSIEDPVTSNLHNVDGTLKILVAARDCGIRRVVFSSSSAVYGDCPEQPNIETLIQRPMSPYAVTKAAGEHYCKVFNDVYGLETVSLRYFNVFGPGQDPSSQYAAVIPKFLQSISQGRPPTIFGDGEQSRDFVYVADVADANALACVAEKAAGRVINIASGKSTTVNELAEILGEILSKDVKLLHVDHPMPGEIKHSSADISAARKLLGYDPRYDVMSGLRDMIKRSKPL
jgi:UDP-glucose 4-epimerase